jgi:hypothetical protein
MIKLSYPEDIEEALFRFRRGKNLGFMVRAGYESSVETKKNSIKTSLQDFESCYKSDYISEKLKSILGKLPKYALHVVFQMIFSHSYYSKLTKKPILEIVNELTSPDQLSFLTHLLFEFEAYQDIKYALDLVRKEADVDSKKACLVVAEHLKKEAQTKEVKLLESKEFRKLKKTTVNLFGSQQRLGKKKRK